MKTAQTTVRQTTGRIGGLICFLAVVLFAAALKFYPAFQGFLLSFQEYTPLYGMTNSPWVGTQNYDQLLNGPYFYSILKNSFVLGFLANLSFCPHSYTPQQPSGWAAQNCWDPHPPPSSSIWVRPGSGRSVSPSFSAGSADISASVPAHPLQRVPSWAAAFC